MPHLDTDTGYIVPDPDDEPADGWPRWASICLIGSLVCSASTLAFLVGLMLGAKP